MEWQVVTLLIIVKAFYSSHVLFNYNNKLMSLIYLKLWTDNIFPKMCPKTKKKSVLMSRDVHFSRARTSECKRSWNWLTSFFRTSVQETSRTRPSSTNTSTCSSILGWALHLKLRHTSGRLLCFITLDECRLGAGENDGGSQFPYCYISNKF